MTPGFLIYDSRSGSTMLASLLDMHPDIVVSFETEVLISALACKERTGALPRGKALNQMLHEDKRLGEWDVNIAKLYRICSDQGEGLTIQFVVNAMFTLLMEKNPTKQGASYFFIKQGLLSGHMDALLSVWPKAAIIHIYRDGRAVYASKKRNKNIDTDQPMSDSPTRSAHRWVGIQTTMRSLAKRARMFDIKYEDLVVNPTANMERLWRFLSLDRTEIQINQCSAYARNLPETQKKIHPLVGRPMEPDRISAWQRALPLKEIFQYERIAHSTLKRRGYHPTCYSCQGIFGLSSVQGRFCFFNERQNSGKIMNIGYLLRTFPQISQTFVNHEIQGLQQKGHNIFLASIYRPGEGIPGSLKPLASKTLYWYDIDKSKLLGILNANFAMAVKFRAAYWRLFMAYRKTPGLFLKMVFMAHFFVKAGVCHIHTHFAWEQIAYLSFIKRLAQIPFSVTLHAADIYMKEACFMDQAVEDAAFFTTISQYNQRYLCREIGIPAKKIHVVHCGVNPLAIRTGRSPGNCPSMILSVGRLTEKKGFDLFISALKQLKDQGGVFKAAIIGHGRLKSSLENQIKQLNLEGDVELLGAMDHDCVIKTIEACDIFVLSCRRAESGDIDGIPVVLMEAMAAEKPVISTLLSGIPELVKPGTGILVPQEDVAALARAMADLLKNRSKAADMGTRARKIVTSEFSIQSQISNLIRLIRNHNSMGCDC